MDSTARLVPVRPSKRRLRGNGANIAIMTSESLVSIGVGLALAAAAGFRVFVPLLALSLAAQSGWIALSPSFAWLATTPASLALGNGDDSRNRRVLHPVLRQRARHAGCASGRAGGYRGERVRPDRSAPVAAVHHRHCRRRRHRRGRPRVHLAAAAEELGGDGRTSAIRFSRRWSWSDRS